MSESRPTQRWETEPRKALIARAVATWEETPGSVRVLNVMIDDVSSGGAAIRIPEPLPVGTKVGIKWHKDEFLGIVKHCRRQGSEYLAGLQRIPPAS